jgi:hypothetical protein
VGDQQDLVEVFGADDPKESEIQPRDSATPINGKDCDASRAPRGSSFLADPALGGEPPARKRGYQDIHIEISNETHYFMNTDDDHETCDTDDEDPRLAK